MGDRPIIVQRTVLFRISPLILAAFLLVVFVWQPAAAQQTDPILPLPGQTANTPQERYYPPRAVGFSSPRVLNGNGFISFSSPTAFPTSLQFGPDQRLYLSMQYGDLYALTIERDNNSDSYRVVAAETLPQIQTIPNHEDDTGQLSTSPDALNKRQITGLMVTGTFDHPILYVSSSDPRRGEDVDTNLDTNSGMITRMVKLDNGWDVVHLVRGLPRSEEYHATNGMALDEATNILYVAQGGNTNRGAPGQKFSFTPEVALSGAILSINLNVINALPIKTDGQGQRYLYDLPTIDDPTRGTAGQPDPGDPFGGNDGLNQAMLVPNGPVQVYSPGYRNPYDLVLTQGTKRLYTFDNSSNNGWGGVLQGDGPGGNCTAQANDQQTETYFDNMHLVTAGHYGGHPNPVRGNPNGSGLYRYIGVPMTSNPPPDQIYDFTPDWSPVPFNMANPIECDFRAPADVEAPLNGLPDDSSIYQINGTTNGMVEYLASNFGNEMKGDILAATQAMDSIRRLEMNAAGNQVTNQTAILSNMGGMPLDVTAQGDADIFPGSIWAAVYYAKQVIAYDPVDFVECVGGNNGSDEDMDGFTNADEIANGTNPCSAGSRPSDFDHDSISDLNDTDDDNDARLDVDDAFAIDASNGQSVNVPFDYPFFNNSPATGFYGLGFTGLMLDGGDYLDQYDPDNLTAGGAAGKFTVDDTSNGSLIGGSNNLDNAFQMGINLSSQSPRVNLDARLEGVFFSAAPVDGQYQGVGIGPGNQGNFLMAALIPNGGNGGIWVYQEVGDVPTANAIYGNGVLPSNPLGAASVDIRFALDPAAGTAQPRVRLNGGNWISLGSPIAIPAAWLATNDATGLAFTLIASSGTSNTPFTATWDYFKGELADGVVVTPTPTTPTPTTPTPETPVPTTPAPTGTELLVNGGFELLKDNGKPEVAPWEVENETGDKVKCNKEDKVLAYGGNCAFRFKGGEGSSKLKQEIDGAGVVFHTGDELTFSLMVDASSDNADGKVKVIVSYNDPALESSKIKFGLGQTTGYTPRSDTTTLTSGDVKKVKVMVVDKSTGGKMYLDNISLRQNTTTSSVMMSLPSN